jgi:hypothetical protein
MNRLFVLSLMACILAVPFANAAELDVGAFVKEAALSYRADFTVDATSDIWEKALDNTYLMGRLWGVYGFRPRYKVNRKGPGIHVADPSGLEGDVACVSASPNRRVFYGAGRINHWAIPLNVTGRALFIFSYRAHEGKVKGKTEIYVAGNRDFTNFLLNVGSFIMKYFINERFRRNLGDMQAMLSDIGKDPDGIRARLAGDDLREFNATFPPSLSRN